jgi:hypothetical protein
MTVGPDGCIGEAGALAEHIAHYPRVRLCECLDGSLHHADWLLHERDRYLIVKALRALAGTGDNHVRTQQNRVFPCA